MHIKRLMRPNGGKRVKPCGRFLPGKFIISYSLLMLTFTSSYRHLCKLISDLSTIFYSTPLCIVISLLPNCFIASIVLSLTSYSLLMLTFTSSAHDTDIFVNSSHIFQSSFTLRFFAFSLSSLSNLSHFNLSPVFSSVVFELVSLIAVCCHSILISFPVFGHGLESL